MEKENKKCILVVDDEALIRLTTEYLLTALGYKVLLAENSHDCFKMVKDNNNSIDLILLDMNMPIMNGKECFMELQKMTPNLKVVFSSGFLVEDEEKLLNYKSVVGIINKPYTIKEMQLTLENIFKT